MSKHSHPFTETVTQLAARFGVSRTHLSEVLNRTAKPSGVLAFQIEEASGGKILARDLLTASAHLPPTSSSAA